MLTQVFERFVQVDRSSAQSRSGLGIGLSLAKDFVALHRGTLTAFSEAEGRGSEFVVRLPIDTARITASSPARHDPAGRLPRHRVLIADDNQDAARSLAMLMDMLGQEVRTARDGQEAVEVAAEFRPELILFDIGMPKLNGHDACRRIRAGSGGRDVFIVAQTGWSHEACKEASREAGFDRHLVKPVGLKDLERLLESASRQETDQ